MDLSFDVMIPAHAESIEQLLNLIMAITFQKVPGWKMRQLLICSDNPKIQAAFSAMPHLHMISQDPRKGKPNALNKMFLRSRAFCAIQNSADCIPASENTYRYLLEPLKDPVCGAVTSKPVPYEPGFLWLPNLVWKCHHFVQPKLNAELFSFKKSAVDFLPETVIHDDAYLHNMVVRCGFQVLYEPRALVFNSVPKTLGEFYGQRKKNVIGNLQLGRDFREFVPNGLRLRALILMSLELLANIHGRLDYARGKIPKGLIGYSLESTKEVFK
jgi:cellulose synthase/poly-beta-1,6-N-acetylglucosamine synthase-like glycosyltransferase